MNSLNNNVDLDAIATDTTRLFEEIIPYFKNFPKPLVNISCSTSAILGNPLGKSSSREVAEVVFSTFDKLSIEHDFEFSVVCCEHLNCAQVIEKTTKDRLQLTEVSVLPTINAGGPLAEIAFARGDWVVVENLMSQANLGLDIGGAIIRQMRDVIVPVSIQTSKIGLANVIFAYSRPKLIGGERAVYKQQV